MTERFSRAPDVETVLAEIDRRLGEIQDELAAARPSEAPAKARGRSGPLAEVLQRTGGTQDEVTLRAGPFSDLQALRAFQQAVAGLPGVLEVRVEGFEGRDRAILEVRLENPPE